MQTSIIIVNYNTYELTYRCIESIYANEKNHNYEIILVDNASDECDASLFLQKFPEVKLIKSSENSGFAGGNNLGIKQSKGNYILLLNSDTKLINNAISIASSILEKEETIGALSGQLQYPDGNLQAVAGRFPSVKRELRELLRLNKFLSKEQKAAYYLDTQWDYNKPVEADWVWGAFLMFRKKDLIHFPNQLLHDTFFMYGEDVQWCYHFKNILKKKIYYTPKPKAIHYIGGSDKNKAEPFERYLQKMLPHEYQWLCMVKGQLYTRIYYFLKSLVYYSLLNKDNLNKGNLFLSIALKGV